MASLRRNVKKQDTPQIQEIHKRLDKVEGRLKLLEDTAKVLRRDTT